MQIVSQESVHPNKKAALLGGGFSILVGLGRWPQIARFSF